MVSTDEALKLIKSKLENMSGKERVEYLGKIGIVFPTRGKEKICLSEKNRKKIESIINEIVLFGSENNAIDCIYYTCEALTTYSDKFEKEEKVYTIVFNIVVGNNMPLKHIDSFSMNMNNNYELNNININIILNNKVNLNDHNLLDGTILFDRTGICTKIQQDFSNKCIIEGKSQCLDEYSNSFYFEPPLNIQKIKKI